MRQCSLTRSPWPSPARALLLVLQMSTGSLAPSDICSTNDKFVHIKFFFFFILKDNLRLDEPKSCLSYAVFGNLRKWLYRRPTPR